MLHCFFFLCLVLVQKPYAFFMIIKERSLRFTSDAI